MKCFKYKIIKDNKLIITNWINSKTKEDATNQLKKDYPDAIIKLIEVWEL